MKKIGSILCCGGGERKDYRRNIYLISGRLVCDGNDITPRVGIYTDIEEAREDVRKMYDCNVWALLLD